MAWCADPLADAIAQAISDMEGYDTPGTLAARNRNPGNLTDPATGAFRVFGSDAEGVAALCRQVDRNIGRGLTLTEFFAGRPGVYPGYAPAGHGDNNPWAYAAFVADRAGIPANVSLLEVDGGGLVFNDGGGAGLSDTDLLLILGLGLVAVFVVLA